MHGRSQSSRDMFRQEAKFQEMTEEVRRRELRGGPPPGRPNVSFGPPPVAPKPLIGEEYRESPPPPPPPAKSIELVRLPSSKIVRSAVAPPLPPRRKKENSTGESIPVRF